MKFKNIAASLILFIIINITTSYSNPALSGESLRLLDSSLSLMNMNRQDLAMPWDFKDDDSQRLKVVKAIFDNPIELFEKTHNYYKNFQLVTAENIDTVLGEILQDLELKEFEPYNLEVAYSQDEMDRLLKTNIDSLIGFTERLILRQYIAPALRAIDAMDYDILERDVSGKKFLLDNMETVVFEEEGDDDTKANVYEIRNNRDEVFKKAKLFFYYADIIKKSNVFDLGISLYKKLDKLNEHILDNLSLIDKKINTTIINTKYGKVAIGGFGDDLYVGDFFLIIDFGGNDSYQLSDISHYKAAEKPVSFIIDFDGDDVYNGGDFSLGGAVMGVNILIDKKGNDIYKAGQNSLGSGLFGLGILHDMDGSDYYSGTNFTQGAGALGIGVLIDEKGNDIYNSYSYAQGFGYTRGFGILADNGGNDNYISSSPAVDVLRYDNHFISFTQGAAIGYRPLASGGIGILADKNGNDNYVSDIYGQGTAYWYSDRSIN